MTTTARDLASSGRTAGARAGAITAVVCTRDRPGALGRALRSLTAQAITPRDVLVVDNAPSTDAACALVRREFPGVRYVREPVAGLDFARNRALREARHDIVAFLDDDAVADPQWVARTLASFARNPRLAVCMGRVDALALDTAGQRLFEANGGFARGPDRIRLPHDADRPLHGWRAPLIAWSISVGSGCSMAVRRHRVLALGGFDEALDLGPALPGGGDLDILWRCLEAGFDVVYEPTVRARHEHRPEARDAIIQIAGHNRALIAVLTKATLRASGPSRVRVLVFLAWRLVKPGARLVRRAFGRDPLPAAALLRLWWDCWRGLAAYPAAIRIARRRREAAR